MANPSPAFRINGGAVGAKASIAATTSFSATLDSTAGVTSVVWSVASTDETSAIANYTLVQSGAKGETVTTTSLTAGTAGILRAVINGGISAQTGLPDPIGTTATAKFYVVTATGLEVGAVNEGFESDPTYGSTGILNAGIRLAAVGTGLGVSNIAALAAIDDTKLTDGTVLPVASVLDEFVLKKSSGLTADGISIITAKSGGAARWHRKCLPDVYWASQSAWKIDSAAGNDESAGDPSHPLKTWRELDRRLGTLELAQATTITIAAAGLGSGDLMRPRFLASALVLIQGTPTTLYTSNGGFTAHTTSVPSSNTHWNVTDSAKTVNWNAAGDGGSAPSYLLYQRIRTTTGSNPGAAGWPIFDTGAKSVRTSEWMIPPTSAPVGAPPANVSVANGDAFVVESLPPIACEFDFEALASTNPSVSQNKIVFSALDFSASPSGASAGSNSFAVTAPGVVFVGCRTGFICGQTKFYGCLSSGFNQPTGMRLEMYAGAVVNDLGFGQCTSQHESAVILDQGTVFEQNGFLPSGHVRINSGGAAFSDASGDGLLLKEGADMFANGRLWGSGNTGTGWEVSAQTRVLTRSSGPPVLTGTLGDWRIAGVVHSNAELNPGTYSSEVFDVVIAQRS